MGSELASSCCSLSLSPGDFIVLAAFIGDQALYSCPTGSPRGDNELGCVMRQDDVAMCISYVSSNVNDIGVKWVLLLCNGIVGWLPVSNVRAATKECWVRVVI